MKKYERNMKKYLGNMKIRILSIYGPWDFARRCVSSYAPFFQYKGTGNWKNSELSPYRLWELEKFRALPI